MASSRNPRTAPQRSNVNCPKCFAAFALGEYTAQGWSGMPAMEAHSAACSGVPTRFACGCQIPNGTPPFFARQAALQSCAEHTK